MKFYGIKVNIVKARINTHMDEFNRNEVLNGSAVFTKKSGKALFCSFFLLLFDNITINFLFRR